MALRLSGPPVGDDQRRRPADRPCRARSSRPTIWREVAALTGLPAGPAALADRQGEARDLRRDAGAERQAAAGAHPLGECRARRRLDRRPDCPRRSKARCVRATRRLRSLLERARLRRESACSEGFAMNVALDHSQDAPSLEALERHISRAATGAARRSSDRTATGVSNSRPTRPSRPNMCCSGISAAKRRISSSSARSPSICAASRATTAAGRCSRRRVRHQRQRQGLFRAEDDRRRSSTRRTCARAREAILAHGGAATSNVFTRFLLALFGEIPWRGVPTMPVEIMLLPRWFPFHLDKISYWARTVLVPLLVLQALKPQARQSARRQDRGAVRRAARDGAPLADGRASGLGWREVLRRDRLAAEARRARFSASDCAAARSTRPSAFVDRAAQRRRRPRRDLSRRWRTPS